MTEINKKVIEWLKEHSEMNEYDIFSKHYIARYNSDGGILVGLNWLESKGLKDKYMVFLKTIKL